MSSCPTAWWPGLTEQNHECYRYPTSCWLRVRRVKNTNYADERDTIFPHPLWLGIPLQPYQDQPHLGSRKRTQQRPRPEKDAHHSLSSGTQYKYVAPTSTNAVAISTNAHVRPTAARRAIASLHHDPSGQKKCAGGIHGSITQSAGRREIHSARRACANPNKSG